ncbi:hypothetical protein [Paenibacillus shenyangensis]|uniref:hypothetical protein n=1 Tax=Paenibacillus sp. A9 TaxID=1284352 RepID=UPI00037754E9|nr:hypothetical protein [Paenibacillus sp. A9]
MKVVVFIGMYREEVWEVKAFVGEDAENRAAAAFEQYTEVFYVEFQRRWETGDEDSYHILGKELGGTGIEILEAE